MAQQDGAQQRLRRVAVLRVGVPLADVLQRRLQVIWRHVRRQGAQKALRLAAAGAARVANDGQQAAGVLQGEGQARRLGVVLVLRWGGANRPLLS